MTAPGCIQQARLDVPTPSGEVPVTLTCPPITRAAVLIVDEPGETELVRIIAARLTRASIATVVTDALTPEESTSEQACTEHRCDVERVARRLIAVTDWIGDSPKFEPLGIGYFASGV